MSNEIKIRAIMAHYGIDRSALTIIESVIEDSDERISKWVEQDRPQQWLKVEEEGKYSCYVDVAYGRIALFEDNELLGIGKTSVITNTGIVALDSSYYGTGSYIFTGAQVNIAMLSKDAESE